METKDILRKNMKDAIARYQKRYAGGHITYKEMQRLIEWEKKNYESGGKLYAERLAKALTPNVLWKWN